MHLHHSFPATAFCSAVLACTKRSAVQICCCLHCVLLTCRVDASICTVYSAFTFMQCCVVFDLALPSDVLCQQAVSVDCLSFAQARNCQWSLDLHCCLTARNCTNLTLEDGKTPLKPISLNPHYASNSGWRITITVHCWGRPTPILLLVLDRHHVKDTTASQLLHECEQL